MNLLTASRSTLQHRFNQLLSEKEPNVVEICKLGSALIDKNLIDESKVCFDFVVEIMLKFIRNKKFDIALEIENIIYTFFVKKHENELHYFNCFQQWSSEFQLEAKKISLPKLIDKPNNRVCFVLQNAVLLGHTEVMLQVICDWRDKKHDVEIYVAAISEVDVNLLNILKKKNITFLHCCGNELKKPPPPAQVIVALRDHFQKLEIYTIVWVSLPTYSSFALSLPLAPHQIFWSLKFHPIYIDQVDAHICGGNEKEVTRTYHKKEWWVCPFPLTVALSHNAEEKINEIRQKFPKGTVLLGSFGREEKYNSPAYIQAIVTLMRNNLQCHFLWAGRNSLPKMQEAFDDAGISDRCHFLGWTDTNFYSEVVDIFLETFPFGCGVTGFQAMGHGTPLLSYNAEDTMYGYQLNCLQKEDPIEAYSALPILTAKNLDHYIALGQRLINDSVYRNKISQRELNYYAGELDMSTAYSTRLLDIILNNR